MITQDVILQVVTAQQANMKSKGLGQKRDAISYLPDLTSYALIVSGVRRCGKSTLLFQLLDDRYPDGLYLNFEDPRLFGFDLKDFVRLDKVIEQNGTNVLLFDEIQIIPDWERYVRQKLDESFKVIITGSNANLLSKELGTKLTGRHITKELFPFSYREFLVCKQWDEGESHIRDYITTGGFPEYIKQGYEDILHFILEDILIRDIAVRYGLKDIHKLQQLALYLLSNVGKPISANRLKSIIEVGSTNTITEYLSYLEDSYLIQLIQKFDYSPRKQLINPRKIYAIDTGLTVVNSTSYSADKGRLLENMVYNHLRRKYKRINYFLDKGECDFVIFDRDKVVQVVQVCYLLNQDNMEREINGLMEAMNFFKLTTGIIVTFGQTEEFEQDNKIIHVMSAHDFLLDKPI